MKKRVWLLWVAFGLSVIPGLRRWPLASEVPFPDKPDHDASRWWDR